MEDVKLYTEHEVVKMLRLDVDRKQPLAALRHLRRTRKIGFLKYGRRIYFRPEHIQKFLDSCNVEAN